MGIVIQGYTKMFKCPHLHLVKFFSLLALFCCSITLPTNQAKALGSVIASGENLDLFGISVHKEQRNDIYVGALFSSNKVDKVSQLLSPEISKRMSLKFVSKYSSRKMARLWKQRIAMNNPKSKWQPMTEEIVLFAGIFKRAMQEGDELNIDFDPISGTSVYLNGTLFLTIDKIDFYDLLLKVWIGSIPPTKDFKVGISGKSKASVTDKLISQYENLQPELGRFDEDKVLIEDAAEVAKKEKDKSTTEKITHKKQSPKQNNKKKDTKKQANTNQKNADVKNTEPEKSKSEKETDVLVSKLRVDLALPTAVVITKPSIKLDDLIVADIGSSTTANSEVKKKPTSDNEKSVVTEKKVAIKTKEIAKPQKKATKQVKPPSIEVEKVASLDLPKKEVFDVDLYSGSYTRELIRKIKKVQWYPKKALVKGEEGEVKIRITIDQAGAVINKTIIQRSGSRTLDRAALKMVGRAQPFPVIPEELNLEQFEFDVPLNFSIRN